MLVREKNFVCWSVLWHFAHRKLVDSPVMSIVIFVDSSDRSAGIKDAIARNSLKIIRLQWEVYTEEAFTSFPLCNFLVRLMAMVLRWGAPLPGVLSSVLHTSDDCSEWLRNTLIFEMSLCHSRQQKVPWSDLVERFASFNTQKVW